MPNCSWRTRSASRASNSCSATSTTPRPRPSPRSSTAASRTNRSPTSPARAISGRSALRSGPGALIPRPDSETLIEAAVAHFAGPRAGDDPRPRHRAGDVAARRAGPMARRARRGRRCLGGGARLCAGQCRAARDERARRVHRRRLGGGDRPALRPGPVQPALCRDRRSASRRRPRSRAGVRAVRRRRRARRLSRHRARNSRA